MATATKPDQAEVYERIEQIVRGGETRAEAFSVLADELGMRAGTLAAHYYREARKRQIVKRGTQPEEEPVTEAAATLDPAAADDDGQEPGEGQDTEAEAPLIGQLAFDGFVVKEHKLKIAGTTVQLSDEEVRELKLGSEISFTFTARVVKRNNHLLTDDDGSHVEHDLVAVMEGVNRS